MIKRAEFRHPHSDLNCDAVLEPPPEPIICWLDCGCPSGKQVRQARSRHAWLFILVCVVIAGGLGLAVWQHNRVATNASGPSLSKHVNGETLRIPRLEATQVSELGSQFTSPSSNRATPGLTSECGPASARLCSEESLFSQLPDLMTPPNNHDMGSQRSNSSPHRELQLLPHPGIVPTPPPGTEDILLERRPGDLG